MTRKASLRWHLLGFSLLSTVLLILAVSSWLLWLVAAWSVLLLVHWLYAKSLAVDESWAKRRAREVEYKSYDFSHIQLIKASYKKTSESECGV
jgi:hypothetical protein